MTKPVMLIIMDGWGIREKLEGNAIVKGSTPNYDYWQRNFERSILDASGEEVGLVPDLMGNSEVGHLNIGAGRVVEQEMLRINKTIKNKTLSKHATLLEAIQKTKDGGGRLHILGLFGPGGVHSHTDHLYALVEMFNDHNVQPVLHLITDGRDTPPNSSVGFLADLQAVLKKTPAVIATLMGRYYAMDRDKHYERNKIAYDAMVNGIGRAVETPEEAIQGSHQDRVTDEFIKPAVISPEHTIQSGDVLLFYNFRADRMRQIVHAFTDETFDHFERAELSDLTVITFTQYADDLPAAVLFPPNNVKHPLARVLSENGLKQFHAAETEKYAHVTYFFNGGAEEPFAGEERMLVSSPRVATYDLQPEMSAVELTDKVAARVETGVDDFLVINFANPDMVGHTGIEAAAIKAVETVDTCVGRLVNLVLEKGGTALVTSDHGNAEQLIDTTSRAMHTYHTTNPVPFFVLSETPYTLRPRGILADITPTILDLLGLEKHAEMTGRSLIRHMEG
jgi:2,3-bisphosphoglycerate-independent phosphoglycerate mutase